MSVKWRGRPGVLKSIRAAKGKTQSEIADSIDMGIATYQRAERGQSVDYDTIVRIAFGYDMKPEDIADPLVLAPSGIFMLLPLNDDGRNWKPDPDTVDEKEGYVFSGFYQLSASQDVIVSAIDVGVRRAGEVEGKLQDLYAWCPDPYVNLDGEELKISGHKQLAKLVTVKARETPYLLWVATRCRAVGKPGDSWQTESIQFWISDPHLAISITYRLHGKQFRETHVFEHPDMVSQELEETSVVEI